MIGAGIDSGDLVLIKKQSTAEFGQIVVALVDNETTLKRLKKSKSTNEIYLHPENPDYNDITVKQYSFFTKSCSCSLYC